MSVWDKVARGFNIFRCAVIILPDHRFQKRNFMTAEMILKIKQGKNNDRYRKRE